jgi:hypothetical protein
MMDRRSIEVGRGERGCLHSHSGKFVAEVEAGQSDDLMQLPDFLFDQ